LLPARCQMQFDISFKGVAKEPKIFLNREWRTAF
jgi:hypothetical protein